MYKHVLKISDDGKNLQLDITNKEANIDITVFTIRKYDEPDYKDISDEIILADTYVDERGLTKYVFNILLESIGYTETSMFYIHLEDANANVFESAVSYLAPTYFALFTILSSIDEVIKLNDFIYVQRLYCCIEAHKMAIEMQRYEEADYLYNQINSLLELKNTRFLDLDNYPVV